MRERLISAFFSVLRATATLGRARAIAGDGAGVIAARRGLVARGLAAVRVGLWSALGTALSADEKSRLGVALYDAGDEYRDSPRHGWEDAWHARWLTGRSRVLVGAAGAGREVLALLERGHEVLALEPSPALAALCRARTGGRVTVIERRYEELAASSPRDFPGVGERPRAAGTVSALNESARRAPSAGLVEFDAVLLGLGSVDPAHSRAPSEGVVEFDAVLLGLGSLSHVLDASSRARLLGGLARACPRGPILASALAPPVGTSLIEAERHGRAARMGRAFARPLRAARHLPPVEAGEIVFDALGFAKLLTREELRALGAACGRRAIFDDGAPDGMILCAFIPA